MEAFGGRCIYFCTVIFKREKKLDKFRIKPIAAHKRTTIDQAANSWVSSEVITMCI